MPAPTAIAQLFHGGADGRALFSEGRQRIARLRPCGLHPGKALGGRANLLLGLPKRALRVVQIGAGLRDRVCVVLEAFRIGHQLALQLFDLCGRLRIFLRQRVQIGLGGQRRGIRFTQFSGKALVLLCGRGHLLLQVGILLLGRVQRFCQPALPGVGIFQLLIRRFQRPFILLDGLLLKRHFLLKAGKLTLGAGYGLLKILHARGGPPEFALGLLNLFVDGREIPGEIISVQ